MSNVKNITIDQGSSFTYTFTLTDVTNDPFDVTAYDARLMVRRSYGDTAVLMNATVTNGKLVISTNTVAWNISPDDTSLIKFNSKDDDTLECVYDLEVISPLSKVYKAAKGTLTIYREVSR